MNKLKSILNLKYLGRSHISLSKAVLFFYLTMMSVINSIGGVNNSKMLFFYTIIAYLWFLFTTKLDLKWALVIISLMIIGLIYENMMVDKEAQSEDDEALEEKDKDKIKEKHNNMKFGFIIPIILTTVVGTYLYLNKKKVQYGGNFDGMKFIFGGPNNV